MTSSIDIVVIVSIAPSSASCVRDASADATTIAGARRAKSSSSGTMKDAAKNGRETKSAARRSVTRRAITSHAYCNLIARKRSVTGSTKCGGQSANDDEKRRIADAVHDRELRCECSRQRLSLRSDQLHLDGDRVRVVGLRAEFSRHRER